jgi:SAM-dependent methyltransferase
LSSQLFRRRPKDSREDYSQSHLDKGADYHERFSTLPGRALMWELEQRVLQEVLTTVRPNRLLDFATGTGRVANVLATVTAGEIHGIDISESMLSTARANSTRVVFHLMDGRRARSFFGDEYFDFVSAFRFFPNADDALRSEAADQIASLLRPGGWLLFNNHRNFWSPSYIGRRLLNRGAEGTENSELERLFSTRGFERVERYSLGLWPQSERRSLLVPWRLTRLIERLNLIGTARFHGFGYNTIWLLRKRASSKADR